MLYIRTELLLGQPPSQTYPKLIYSPFFLLALPPYPKYLGTFLVFFHNSINGITVYTVTQKRNIRYNFYFLQLSSTTSMSPFADSALAKSSKSVPPSAQCSHPTVESVSTWFSCLLFHVFEVCLLIIISKTWTSHVTVSWNFRRLSSQPQTCQNSWMCLTIKKNNTVPIFFNFIPYIS